MDTIEEKTDLERFHSKQTINNFHYAAHEYYMPKYKISTNMLMQYEGVSFNQTGNIV